MSRCTLTRVELINVPHNHHLYDNLHAALAQEGFQRTIESDDKKRFRLPHATYARDIDYLGLQQVTNIAYRIATALRPGAAVITSSMPMAWEGLEPL